MASQKKSGKNDAVDGQPEVSFEKAIERLEAIVAEMEAGKTGLETMIERFEEGQKLISLCTKRLNEVERRIEILTKKGDQPETEPFEADVSDDDDGDALEDKPGNKGSQELF